MTGIEMVKSGLSDVYKARVKAQEDWEYDRATGGNRNKSYESAWSVMKRHKK